MKQNNTETGIVHILLILLTFFTFLIIVVIFLPQSFFDFYKNPSPKPAPIPAILQKSQSSLKIFENEQYNILTEKLIEITKQDSPRAAMDILSEKVDSDQQLANVCHTIVHLIGNTAYDKYQDVSEALKYKEELCGSGYTHGVIERKLALSTSVIYDLKKLCNNTNDGNCYHGVGHGAMYYTNNDLPNSLSICNTFKTSDQKNTCYEGVFMENFNSDLEAHPNSYLHDDDTFYPCTQLGTSYKGACYFYAPRYYLRRHKLQYTSALTWCNDAEDKFKTICINGIGSAVMKENINNPLFVAKFCDTDPQNRNYCIDGMTSYYLVHYYSLEKGKEMCQKLDEKDAKVCLSAVAKRSQLFPKQS